MYDAGAMFAIPSNLASACRGASFPLCSLKEGLLPPLPPILGVSRSPEEICSLEAALKHFLGVPLSHPHDPQKENLDCAVHRAWEGAKESGAGSACNQIKPRL